MNNYLQEAIRIGDHLLESAKYTTNGVLWETHQQKDNSTIWSASEDIYTGVCGIVIFLLALYQVTRIEKYLETAKKAMEWVEWYCVKNNSSSNYAFLTGRIGVSYTFLRLYKVTKDRKFFIKALDHVEGYLYNMKIDKFGQFDYLNGMAGSLIVLLHLFDVEKLPLLYQAIIETTKVLTKKAKYTKVGLHWEQSYDKIPFQIWPLCGFSHGSSGLGFVFLELGNYFQNTDYFYIAHQAFVYDNSKYDSLTENWPCALLEIYEKHTAKNYEKLFKEGTFKAFYEPHDYNKWCHGAAGIGLTRLHALKYIKNGRYKKDIQHALKKTLQTQLLSSCICHGNSGNAELFIEYYLVTKDIQYLKQAQKIADKVLLQRKTYGKYILGMYNKLTDEPEDPGLFWGIAGIGYFMLRVSYPEIVESILIPTISPIYDHVNTNKKYIMKSTQHNSIRRKLMENIFPETILQLSLLNGEKLHAYFSSDPMNDSEKDSFIFFIRNLLLTFGSKEKEKLQEIFDRESIKLQLIENHNNAYLFIKERVLKKRAEEILTMNQNDFLNLELELSSEAKIIEQKESLLLIKRLCDSSVEEMSLNTFIFQILNLFKEKKTVWQVIDQFITVNEFKDKMKNIVEEKVTLQIKEAVKSLVLIEPQKVKEQYVTENFVYFR